MDFTILAVVLLIGALLNDTLVKEGIKNRGLRQLGEPHSSEELLEQLRSCIHPHQNRSSLNSRTAVLAEQAHAVLKLASKPGIRSEAEKRQLTEGWLELALSCAKISVKYEADVLKQQQKQEQAALQQEMG